MTELCQCLYKVQRMRKKEKLSQLKIFFLFKHNTRLTHPVTVYTMYIYTHVSYIGQYIYVQKYFILSENVQRKAK